MPQVTKDEGYTFEKYGGVSRFASYAHQLQEIFRINPRSVLEIGVGDGVVGSYLRQGGVIKHTWADIAEDLHPEVVADVRALPFADESFDASCAFEVLEHLPFEDFEKAVAELARVARTHVLLSLPHFGPPIKWLIKIPFLPEIRFAWKVPFPRVHTFNGQHYWEIGKRGYPPKRIREVLKKYGTIEREFIPFENQYHHFFVVRITKKS